MDDLWIFCACRRSTPGERKVLMVLLVGGIITGGLIQLLYGYSGASETPKDSIRFGYFLLGSGILGPLIIRKLLDSITDKI
jgi:hypothetical protein